LAEGLAPAYVSEVLRNQVVHDVTADKRMFDVQEVVELAEILETGEHKDTWRADLWVTGQDGVYDGNRPRMVVEDDDSIVYRCLNCDGDAIDGRCVLCKKRFTMPLPIGKTSKK
jgi:hypothetical protein